MNKEDLIYIIGHKSPDTDTVCSAIAYAEYLNQKGFNVISAITGEINLETKYVLDYFKFETPVILDSLSQKNVILVDHNEESQRLDGFESANIIEVIDHHKINFTSSEPINFQVKPLGSTASLIAERMFNDKNFEISKPLAGILISAILSDTVVFKSNTTTPRDIEIAETLNKIAQIEDLQTFGIEIKKKKASLKGLNPEKIIYSDFKTFEACGNKFGVGQIEVVDLSEAKEMKKDLLEKMNEIAKRENLLFVILMMTDIINEGSELLISDNCDCIEKAFNKKVNDNCVYLDKMMSRKKDLLPVVMKILEA